MRRAAICTVVLLLALPPSAAAATITFGNTSLFITPSYSEAGFDVLFSGLSGLGYIGQTTDCDPTCADSGSHWAGLFVTFSFADTMTVRAASGGEFHLGSFWGAESFSGFQPLVWASAIRVTGVRPDLSTVTQDFALDLINDGQGGVADFEVFAWGFSDALVEVRFTGLGGGGEFIVDNITLAPIPEPATLLLLGTGLAAAGVRRRLKKRS